MATTTKSPKTKKKRGFVSVTAKGTPRMRALKTPEAAEAFLQCIRDGDSIAAINQKKIPGMPSGSGMLSWIANDPELAEEYARALKIRSERDAFEIEELMNEEPEYVTTATGQAIDNAWVQRQKMRIDTMKWLMGKRDKGKYGDQAASVNVTTSVVVITPEEAEARVCRILPHMERRMGVEEGSTIRALGV